MLYYLTFFYYITWLQCIETDIRSSFEENVTGIKNILSGSLSGQIITNFYEKNKFLAENGRNLLSECIVESEMIHNNYW